MINLKFLKANAQLVKQKCAARGIKINVANILKINEKYQTLLLNIEQKKAQKNQIAKLIANDLEKMSLYKNDIVKLNEEITAINEQLKKTKAQLDKKLATIPNIIHDSVPLGKDENDNVEVKRFLEPKKLNFQPLSHWELGKKLNIIDLELATKIAGSRFSVYKNKGAALIRALQKFTLDIHKESGYEEYLMPVIVNANALYGTGQLPKFKNDLFRLKYKDFYLSPTVEVQLTNMYANQILQPEILPIKVTSSTLNFRSESGAANKDIKGLIRQHQFYKTELVNFSKPEQSFFMLEEMTKQACKVLEALELPYRVVSLCSGDIGFATAKTYDIEVWLPYSQCYREISSCSNCTDFQARRLGIRYRDEKTNKNQFVHTLNGSGIALDRLWVAIVENYQTANQQVAIPKALEKYLDFKII